MPASIALRFFPANHAWAFTFGDSMLRMSDDQPMFFESAKAARAVALERRILVAEDGTCFTKTRSLPECFSADAAGV